MSDFECYAPGGVYVVPKDFYKEFKREFPEYRIRWSLRKHCWQIEQHYGRGALSPIRIDPYDDSLVRAKDGYWLVMEIQPGDRMTCPAIVDFMTKQRCGTTLHVAHCKTAETICPTCRKAGRDGRFMASYWPFGGALLEHLRFTDPLRDGIRRSRMAVDEENKRQKLLKEAKRRDAATSIDYVDYRWLTGIASSTGKTRYADDQTFS